MAPSNDAEANIQSKVKEEKLVCFLQWLAKFLHVHGQAIVENYLMQGQAGVHDNFFLSPDEGQKFISF